MRMNMYEFTYRDSKISGEYFIVLKFSWEKPKGCDMYMWRVSKDCGYIDGNNFHLLDK